MCRQWHNSPGAPGLLLGRSWPLGVCHPDPQKTSSSTFVLSIMEPLLPKTAEGSDARARPDEDAGMGGVLRKLEATGTEGDKRRESLVLRHPGPDAHARQGLESWGCVVGGGSVWGRENNELRFDSQVLQADLTHHHLALRSF